MNNCHNYSKWFSAYIDGELAPHKRQKLDQHISTCSACAQQIYEMQQLEQNLHALPRLEISSSFDVILHAQLRKEMRREQQRTFRFPFLELNWKIPAYATAAVILVFVGIMLQRFATMSPSMTQNPNSIAYLIQESQTDPGHFVITKIDSSSNRFEIINYVDIDKARPSSGSTLQRARIQGRGTLPDLRTATQNEFNRTARATDVRAQIRTVNEFSF